MQILMLLFAWRVRVCARVRVPCVRSTRDKTKPKSAGMEIRIHDLMCEGSSRGCVAPNVADIQELYCGTRQARASV